MIFPRMSYQSLLFPSSGSKPGWVNAGLNRFFVLLAVMSLLFGVKAADAAQTPTRLMEEAIRARSQGDLDGAILNLAEASTTAVRKEQKVLALLMLGDCQLHAGSPDKALVTYQELIDQKPSQEEEAEARFRQAQCHLLLGRTQKTREICRDLKKRFPKTEFAKLAEHLMNTSSSSESSKVASSQAVRRDAPVELSSDRLLTAPVASKKPKVGEVENKPQPQKSATMTENQEKPLKTSETSVSVESSRKPYVLTNKDLEISSNDSTTVRDLQQSGKFQEVEDISTALEQDKQPVFNSRTEKPNVSSPRGDQSRNSEVSDNLTELLTFPKLSKDENEGLATEILKDQEEIQLNSGGTPSAELLLRLAGNTARFGELKEACRLYDQLLRLHPSSRFVEEAYFEAIRMRVILKANKAAQDWGAIFLKSFPRSPRRKVLQKLLEHAAQAERKKPARSSRTITKPATTDTLSNEPHYREGARLRQAGQYSLALEHFQRLTVNHPKSSRLWHELALLEVQMHLYPQAEEHLKKLLEIEPNHGEGRSLLGYIHFQRRDYQKAAGDYAQALEKKGERAVPNEGLTFFDSESAARRLHQADRRKGDEP